MTPVFKVWGVFRVTCGYSGGDLPCPTYKEVKSQTTGHRETIELEYDPSVVGYGKLLDLFLANIDPFDKGGQYIDRGRSYTAAIYYQNGEEKAAALEKLSGIEAASGKKTAVSVEPFKCFYTAEDEHQDYYLKNPGAFEAEMKNSGRPETAR